MKQYIEALKYCFENGSDVESRAGKVRKNFGFQMRFDLQKGFPAMTTKKLAWKSVVSELLWFLEGSDDERRLAEILYEDKRENLKDKKTIWTQNANSNYWKDKAKFEGDVGRIYGVQ
ncbi:MAG: thymidylate synthase, partial [Alphaproteobacteria bacterium]